MNKNKKQYTVEFEPNTHTYTVDGQKVRSVTQVINEYCLGVDYSQADPDALKSHADKGRVVHAEIERYIKTGEKGFSPELDWFIDGFVSRGYKVEKSEYIVANDCLAGTVDICGVTPDGKKFIADIKTTSKVHKDAVSWQLSLYEYLDGEKYDKHLCVHLNGGCDVVEIEPQPDNRVESLIDAVRLNVPFADPMIKDLVLTEQEQNAVVALQTELDRIDAMEKAVVNRKKTILEMLKNKMRECGVKKHDNPYFTLTYVAPTTRNSFDTERFKKDHPELWGDYQKTTAVADSVRIKLKGEINL